MRSILLEHDPKAEFVEIVGDKLHHLVHVVRIEADENILLLNGQGVRTLCQVQSISKKSLRVKIVGDFLTNSSHQVDVAIGIPKKDALESCLKQSCELGIRNIFLVRASYSQIKVPEAERIQSILESGVEQSNSAYIPVVKSFDWEAIPWADYESVILLDSQTGMNQVQSSLSGKILLVIGPEGGFSPEEMSIFDQLPNLKRVLLPTAILRTPTALSAGVGFVLGALLD